MNWERTGRRDIALRHFARTVTPLPPHYWRRRLAEDIYGICRRSYSEVDPYTNQTVTVLEPEIQWNQRLEGCIQNSIAPILQSIHFHQRDLISKADSEQRVYKLYASYGRDERTLDKVYRDGVVAARAFATKARPMQPTEHGLLVVDLLSEAGEEVLPLRAV
ncbi:hypothetical protein BDZ89DRAFT_1134324 [Hymenopellis radicata]|nr:hypothetical protein BDZ89DRAFT_1134324 [Hymenopellis radicata]